MGYLRGRVISRNLVRGLLALEDRPESCHRETRDPLLSFHSHGAQVTWCRPHSSAGHLFTRPKAGEAHTPTLPTHSSGATLRRVVLGELMKEEEARQEARALMGEDDSGRTQSSLPPQCLPASSCGGPVRQAFFSVRHNIQRESACPVWSRIDLESLSLTLGISRQPHPLLPESPSPFQHIHCHSAPL